MNGAKYNTVSIRATTGSQLADKMQDLWDSVGEVSVRNVTVLQEMDISRLNPKQGTLYFTAIVTYRDLSPNAN